MDVVESECDKERVRGSSKQKPTTASLLVPVGVGRPS